jgi:hypothetical protein
MKLQKQLPLHDATEWDQGMLKGIAMYAVQVDATRMHTQAMLWAHCFGLARLAHQETIHCITTPLTSPEATLSIPKTQAPVNGVTIVLG